ncbi:cleavage and polyadenylation specificity factor subunit 6, partial [Rhincodon typus]|uniref:cleavage and polyadenylation specificity factor subunit 6 n=1 Tax=Rhincodon typus TaxID=259920 RepID=UPI00202E480B
FQETDYAANDQVDLYDDVIAAADSNNHEDQSFDEIIPRTPGEPQKTDNNTRPTIVYTYGGKRQAVYVGNLTWVSASMPVKGKTPDPISLTPVLGRLLESIIKDKVIENVKLSADQFAEVYLGSESSVRCVMELLPKRELHGQRPEVMPCNKQNLNQFEAQSKKRQNPQRSQSHDSVNSPDHRDSPLPRRGPSPAENAAAPPRRDKLPPSFQLPSRPPYGEHPHGIPPPGLLPPPMSLALNSGYGPPLQVQPGPLPPPGAFLARPGPPGSIVPPLPPGLPPHLIVPPPGAIPPAPHINPAFFITPNASLPSPVDSRGLPPPPGDVYGRPSPSQYNREEFKRGRDPDSSSPPLSEAEFEEMMNKNRAISSSAISKAVAGASTGDYGNAIETLLTAIALIRQSKVAADDRCKVLVSSLQDCLHGIESKSYGSGSRKRERSRDREYSRSHDRSRRHRERSHSEDRHEDYHRERSRERDRHRDRDRDKEREREREYRHR